MGLERREIQQDGAHVCVRVDIEHGGDAKFLTEAFDIGDGARMRADKEAGKNLRVKIPCRRETGPFSALCFLLSLFQGLALKDFSGALQFVARHVADHSIGKKEEQEQSEKTKRDSRKEFGAQTIRFEFLARHPGTSEAESRQRAQNDRRRSAAAVAG